MRGFSTFWFESLFDGVELIDIWGALARSIRLGLVVMVLTVIFSPWPVWLFDAICSVGLFILRNHFSLIGLQSSLAWALLWSSGSLTISSKLLVRICKSMDN